MKREWNRLVYELCYPGILGSMLFDIADPLRSDEPTVGRACRILIALCFALDWINLILNLRADKKEVDPIRWGMDLAIAALLAMAYFSASHAMDATNSGSPAPLVEAGTSSSMGFWGMAAVLEGLGSRG